MNKRFFSLAALFVLLATLTACQITKKKTEESPPPKIARDQKIQELSLGQQIQALQILLPIAEILSSNAFLNLDQSNDPKGIDLNNNGVRDDVEVWISEQPIPVAQRKAIMQIAVVFQKTIFVNLKDKVAVQTLNDELMAATACVFNIFESTRDVGKDLVKKTQAITFNTEERALPYVLFNVTPINKAIKVPEGNTCK
jgi:predicted component of type VI protein secretion system